MKKLLYIVLLFVSVLSITGCKSNNIGTESDIVLSKNEVTLSLKKDTLTNTGATFILKNVSKQDYEYGEAYSIEIKQNEKWHKINVELYFNMPAYNLKSNEQQEININWESGYGKLKKGQYRLIKNIQNQVAEGQYESFYVAKEFTIE